MQNTSLIVDRKNIESISVHHSTLPELKEGGILIKVDEFALTANNITYAAIGEVLQYWNFFPSKIQGKGIVPVWGYASIVESKHPDIAVDTRIYGYLPMAKYFIAEPGKITPHGFRDMAEHRQKNAVIYNNYDFISGDNHTHQSFKYAPLIRPLFTTSFLLYHFFADVNFMDADQIILTSASSKTALGLASMLHQNPTPTNLKVVGLTSQGNLEFVRSTGLYDQVISYGEIAEIKGDKTVIADFAGNKELLQKIDHQLEDHLIFISGIGLTDWESNDSSIQLPKAKMFFAPTFAQVKLKEWGVARGMGMIKSSMDQFIQTISEWITIKNIQGLSEAKEIYQKMAAGDVDPQSGIMIQLD